MDTSILEKLSNDFQLTCFERKHHPDRRNSNQNFTIEFPESSVNEHSEMNADASIRLHMEVPEICGEGIKENGQLSDDANSLVCDSKDSPTNYNCNHIQRSSEIVQPHQCSKQIVQREVGGIKSTSSQQVWPHRTAQNSSLVPFEIREGAGMPITLSNVTEMQPAFSIYSEDSTKGKLREISLREKARNSSAEKSAFPPQGNKRKNTNLTDVKSLKSVKKLKLSSETSQPSGTSGSKFELQANSLGKTSDSVESGGETPRLLMPREDDVQVRGSNELKESNCSVLQNSPKLLLSYPIYRKRYVQNIGIEGTSHSASTANSCKVVSTVVPRFIDRHCTDIEKLAQQEKNTLVVKSFSASGNREFCQNPGGDGFRTHPSSAGSKIPVKQCPLTKTYCLAGSKDDKEKSVFTASLTERDSLPRPQKPANKSVTILQSNEVVHRRKTTENDVLFSKPSVIVSPFLAAKKPQLLHLAQEKLQNGDRECASDQVTGICRKKQACELLHSTFCSTLYPKNNANLLQKTSGLSSSKQTTSFSLSQVPCKSTASQPADTPKSSCTPGISAATLSSHSQAVLLQPLGSKEGYKCQPKIFKQHHKAVSDFRKSFKVAGPVSVNVGNKKHIIKKLTNESFKRKALLLNGQQCSRTFGFTIADSLKRIGQFRQKGDKCTDRTTSAEMNQQVAVPAEISDIRWNVETPRSLPDLIPSVDKGVETTTGESILHWTYSGQTNQTKNKRKNLHVVKLDVNGRDAGTDSAGRRDFFIIKKKSKKPKGEKVETSKTDSHGSKKATHSQEGRDQSDSEGDFRCAFCRKRFLWKKSFIIHTRTHTVSDMFSCVTCGRSYSSSTGLERHVITHKRSNGVKNVQFYCKICKKEFVYASSYQKHMHRHKAAGNQLFPCEKCKFKAIDLTQLHQHMRAKHCDKRYKCKICARLFFVKETLLEHRKAHSTNNAVIGISSEETLHQALGGSETEDSQQLRFPCKLCKTVFTKKNLYKDHLRLKHRTVAIEEAVRSPFDTGKFVGGRGSGEGDDMHTSETVNDMKKSGEVYIDEGDTVLTAIDSPLSKDSTSSIGQPQASTNSASNFNNKSSSYENKATVIVHHHQSPNTDSSLGDKFEDDGQRDNACGMSTLSFQTVCLQEAVSTLRAEDASNSDDHKISCIRTSGTYGVSASKALTKKEKNGKKRGRRAKVNCCKSDEKRARKGKKTEEHESISVEIQEASAGRRNGRGNGSENDMSPADKKGPHLEICIDKCDVLQESETATLENDEVNDDIEGYLCEKQHESRPFSSDGTSGSFLCDVCSEVFSSADSFQKHLHCHNENATVATGAHSAVKELREKHGASRDCSVKIPPMNIFECESCKKTFSDVRTLKRHEKKHDDEKGMSATSCDLEESLHNSKKSGKKIFVDEHFVKHTPEMETFSCVKCFGIFSTKGKLTQHIKDHHCGQDKTHWAARRGKKNYDSDAPFTCDVCGRQYQFPTPFRQHQEHHEKHSYCCGICGQVIMLLPNVRRHVKFHFEPKNEKTKSLKNSENVAKKEHCSGNGVSKKRGRKMS